MNATLRWPHASVWPLILVCTVAVLGAARADQQQDQAPAQAPNVSQGAEDKAAQDKPAEPKVAYEKERQAAQWALRVGGTVEVRTADGKTATLAGGRAELPEGNLTVVAIDVANCAEVKDEGLQILAGSSAIQRLNLAGTNITDAGMASLAGLKTLSSLDLQNTKVGDAGVESLKELTALAHLNLAGTAITDAAITTLSDLAELETLNISGTAVSSVNYLSGLEKFWRLDASNTKVTTLSLRQITWLSLGGNAISDRELTRLVNLKKLTHLELWRTGINDNNVANLAQMTQLKHLDLAGTALTSAGLAKLRPLAGLESLDLTETQIDDSGIEVLQSFPDLQVLSLAGTNITDRALETMANFRNRLQNLTRLYLFRTPITSRGLENIATAAPNLVYLCLSGTQVGDRAVRYLRELSRLSEIELYDTAMTPAALAQLRQAMPQLQVLASR